MPIADNYYWRLRFSGMYHYFVEDIPHLLLSVLVVVHAQDSGDPDGDWPALVRIAFSVSSIVFGVLNRCYQRAAERELQRASLSEPGGDDERREGRRSAAPAGATADAAVLLLPAGSE